MKLLACCTEGKNASTEIHCQSLLPLDDIVNMVEHMECIPEVLNEYNSVSPALIKRLKHSITNYNNNEL